MRKQIHTEMTTPDGELSSKQWPDVALLVTRHLKDFWWMKRWVRSWTRSQLQQSLEVGVHFYLWGLTGAGGMRCYALPSSKWTVACWMRPSGRFRAFGRLPPSLAPPWRRSPFTVSDLEQVWRPRASAGWQAATNRYSFHPTRVVGWPRDPTKYFYARKSLIRNRGPHMRQECSLFTFRLFLVVPKTGKNSCLSRYGDFGLGRLLLINIWCSRMSQSVYWDLAFVAWR